MVLSVLAYKHPILHLKNTQSSPKNLNLWSKGIQCLGLQTQTYWRCGVLKILEKASSLLSQYQCHSKKSPSYNSIFLKLDILSNDQYKLEMIRWLH